MGAGAGVTGFVTTANVVVAGLYSGPGAPIHIWYPTVLFRLLQPRLITGFQAKSWVVVMLFSDAIESHVSFCCNVYTLQVFTRHKLPLVGKPEQNAARSLSSNSQLVAIP